MQDGESRRVTRSPGRIASDTFIQNSPPTSNSGSQRPPTWRRGKQVDNRIDASVGGVIAGEPSVGVCNAWVGAGLEQQRHGIHPLPNHRLGQRRPPFLVFRVDVGLGLQQRLGGRNSVVRGRDVQRRLAYGGKGGVGIQGGVLLNQQFPDIKSKRKGVAICVGPFALSSTSMGTDRKKE